MPKVALTVPAKFIKFAVLAERDKCWSWKGYISDGGYALIRCSRFNIRAHRFAYESYIGAIPEGLVLDHECRNRACVNPWHLKPMTRVQNILIGINILGISTKLYCKNRHYLSPENCYFDKDGHRTCKECHSQRQKDRNRQRKSSGRMMP